MLVFDSRNCQRYVNKSAVLTSSYCFVMVNFAAGANALENRTFLVEPIRWYQHCNRLTYCFLRCIAKQTFGSLVPTSDDTIQVFADDCVVGRFNDCRKQLAGDLCFLPLGDIAQI